ncbi:hypothetical protein E4T56_gene8685 [Termitomyces sp. T112]|nr:hypothetical protein E4T56_gene8685 [Termitomyces sp. T112]
MPTLGNSNTSLANPNSPLANSDIFSAAANASPGFSKPLEPSPAVSDSVIHHQPITLVSPTHSGISMWPALQSQLTLIDSAELHQTPPPHPLPPGALQ